MQFSLEGKTALVTGAGRGIGRGIALELAKAGADVVVSDICSPYGSYPTYDLSTMDDLQQTATKIKDFGRKTMTIKCDVTKWDQVQSMVKQTIDEFDKIDILVNNAGIMAIAYVVGIDEDSWDAVMDVNVKGVFLCTKATLPHMMERKGGKIINIASIMGKRGQSGVAHYCASKFAVIGFTQAVALEVMEHNINVNAICPGTVNTRMWSGKGAINECYCQVINTTPDEFYKIFVKNLPFSRAQTPEDVGRTAVFLATMDEITGKAFDVAGGSGLQAFYRQWTD